MVACPTRSRTIPLSEGLECLQRGRIILQATLNLPIRQATNNLTSTMADEEIATKAPESDAQLSNEPKQPSMISDNDTPAQKGASMGVTTLNFTLTEMTNLK